MNPPGRPKGEYRSAQHEGAPVTRFGAQLLSREVLPFYLALLVLGATALACDALLHLADAVWVGRYLGIPGTLLIIGVCLADLLIHPTGTAALGNSLNNLTKTGTGALLGVTSVTPG